MNHVLVDEVLLRHAHQHEQRRVQAQRLLDRVLGDGELAQRRVAHRRAVAEDAIDLGDHALRGSRGFCSSSISVHAVVTELVWCPANMPASSMPVISCSVSARPSA